MNSKVSFNRLALLLGALALGVWVSARAADFTYDNMPYNIVDADAKTCELARMDEHSTSGAWNVADRPVHNGVTYTTVAIGDSAFYNCAGVLYINLPNTIRRIGDRAFSNCTRLIKVTMQAGVNSIGNYAFNKCASMETVAIPNTVTTMGVGVFQGCSTLSDVTWSQGMTNVPDYTFYNCYALLDWTMPHWLTKIGEYAFAYTGLKQAILPYGLKSLLSGAFIGSEVTTVLIPSSVNTIYTNMFDNCPCLTTLYCNLTWTPAISFTGVPAACEFYVPVNCVKQYKNKWPGRTDHIKAGAYDYNYGGGYNARSTYHMTVLSTTPIYHDGVMYDGTAAYVYHPNIGNVESFTPSLYETDNMCGSGKRYLITEVGDSCFYAAFDWNTQLDFTECSALRKLGHDAFWSCKAERLTLPASVTDYGAWSLYSMPYMTDLTVNNPTPVSISNKVFDSEDYENITLHVPSQEAVQAYKAKPYWKNFARIVTDETGLRGDVDDSGDITPADISALINYLLNGSEINMANADCDLDGDITPADISALINYLLGGNVWPATIKAPAAKQEMNLFEVPAMGKAPVKVSATKAVAKAIDLAKTHPAPRQRPQQRQQASRAKVAPAKVAPAVHNEPNGYIVDDKAI